MTDNEIIKTFAEATKDALELIERQQSEIERLKLQLAVKDKKIECLCGIAGAIRKQSVEKFTEKLIRKSELMSTSAYAVPERAVFVSDIENVAKEMTGFEIYDDGWIDEPHLCTYVESICRRFEKKGGEG